MGDTPGMPKKRELWGVGDVAKHLGIQVMTAYQWRRRGKLPEPDYTLSGRPIWMADKFRRWAERERSAGRL